ncbi:hypothetical protein WA577_004662 [Blastocystis sp. JDR]
MEEGPTEYFTSLVKETKEKAEHAIKVKLPQKICDLNTYIESIQHELLQMEEVSTVDNKKDIVPCNDRIVELNAKLKEEMADFLDIFDVLEMWIVYNRAPSDNGHPLGEEVQERPFDRCEK